MAPSGPQWGLNPNPGPPRLASPPAVLNAPPSIHQVQVFLASGAGKGALVRAGLLRSAAPALGAAAASATTETPARRAIRTPWLVLHFIHPCGEPYSTVACIRTRTLLLSDPEE